MKWVTKNRGNLKTVENLKKRIDENSRNVENLNEEKGKYPSYRIIGKIEDMDQSIMTAIIWGRAVPETEYRDGQYQPGLLLDENNITVVGIDPKGIKAGNYYIGVHCFGDKVPAKGRFGNTVSNYVYGSCPQLDDLNESISRLNKSNESTKEKLSNLEVLIDQKSYVDLVETQSKDEGQIKSFLETLNSD